MSRRISADWSSRVCCATCQLYTIHLLRLSSTPDSSVGGVATIHIQTVCTVPRAASARRSLVAAMCGCARAVTSVVSVARPSRCTAAASASAQRPPASAHWHSPAAASVLEPFHTFLIFRSPVLTLLHVIARLKALTRPSLRLLFCSLFTGTLLLLSKERQAQGNFRKVVGEWRGGQFQRGRKLRLFFTLLGRVAGVDDVGEGGHLSH